MFRIHGYAEISPRKSHRLRKMWLAAKQQAAGEENPEDERFSHTKKIEEELVK